MSRTDERALHRLRIASCAEGATLLLLLLVAVPLKRLADVPQGVSVLGPVHGAVFLLFGGMLLQALAARRLGRADAARLLLAAFVPFGAFLLGGVFRRLRQAAGADAPRR